MITTEELVQAIRTIHRMYYDGSFLKSPDLAMDFHQSLETLFDFAEIKDTLVENNPNGVSPSDFIAITGAKIIQ